MPGVVGRRCEISQISSVGELVEIDHRLVLSGKPIAHEIASNKASTASY